MYFSRREIHPDANETRRLMGLPDPAGSLITGRIDKLFTFSLIKNVGRGFLYNLYLFSTIIIGKSKKDHKSSYVYEKSIKFHTFRYIFTFILLQQPKRNLNNLVKR